MILAMPVGKIVGKAMPKRPMVLYSFIDVKDIGGQSIELVEFEWVKCK